MLSPPETQPDWAGLKDLRIDWELDVEQAAQLADVSPQIWMGWETGTRRMPPPTWARLRKTLIKLSVQIEREKMKAPKPGVTPPKPPKPKKPDKPPKPKKPDKTPVPADIVKMHREVAQLTRDQAAALVGVTPRAWQAYELGTRNMPRWMLDRFDGILTGRLDGAGNPVEYVPPPPPTLAQVMTQTLHARPVPKPMPTLPEIAFRPPTPQEEKAMADLMHKGLKMSEAAVRKAQAKVVQEQERLRQEAEKKFGKPEHI